ncbi:MAG: hypothetical protein ACRDPW_05910 [Mycobacteriales bacterium]
MRCLGDSRLRCHSDTGGNSRLCATAKRLAQAGTLASIETDTDSYDNALVLTAIGLYKNECVRADSPFRRYPLRTVDDVELTTLG